MRYLPLALLLVACDSQPFDDHKNMALLDCALSASYVRASLMETYVTVCMDVKGYDLVGPDAFASKSYQ